MHLMYTLDGNGKRVYTLKKIVEGEVTKSAHPARFSPDDKYSKYVLKPLLENDLNIVEGLVQDFPEQMLTFPAS